MHKEYAKVLKCLGTNIIRIKIKSNVKRQKA